MEIKSRLQLGSLLPKNPVTVELGVAEGLFSRDILNEWKPKTHYMVDLWEQQHDTTGDGAFPQGWHDANLKNVNSIIKSFPAAVVIKSSTVEAAKKVKHASCDLVYIDACHAYECVRADIRAWWPKLKAKGVMAFHDYGNPDYGVTEAVKEWAKSKALDIKVIPENGPDAGAYIIKIK